MEKLQDGCRQRIGNFTVEEAEDIKMNRKLMASCAPMIKQFCKASHFCTENSGNNLQNCLYKYVYFHQATRLTRHLKGGTTLVVLAQLLLRVSLPSLNQDIQYHNQLVKLVHLPIHEKI